MVCIPNFLQIRSITSFSRSILKGGDPPAGTNRTCPLIQLGIILEWKEGNGMTVDEVRKVIKESLGIPVKPEPQPTVPGFPIGIAQKWSLSKSEIRCVDALSRLTSPPMT
jgi:hypothetical protein